MYLTKLQLDLRSPSTRQALADCGDMHRNIQALFECDRKTASVLYRVYSSSHGCYVYILSAFPPLMDAIALNKGMHLVAISDTEQFEDSLEDGKVYSFNLLACPCRKIARKGHKNSQRRFIRNSEEQLNWLSEKAESSGFQIITCINQEVGNVTTSQKDQAFTFVSVQYTGQLCITDSKAFLKAWKAGIGPEKAYGMGMLLFQ